jgi:hypothetical protein
MWKLFIKKKHETGFMGVGGSGRGKKIREVFSQLSGASQLTPT